MKTPNGTVLLPPEERGRGEAKGVDLDPARRPGYGSRRGIRPFPHARWPVEPQPRTVKVLMHGRPNKTFPPVFGTDVPPHGLSGKLREAAYRYPDHMMRHHTMRLFADRVDVWESRAKKLLIFGLPAALTALAVRALRARRLEASGVERRVEFIPEEVTPDVGAVAGQRRDRLDEPRVEQLAVGPDLISG